jgi:hypothetical protein
VASPSREANQTVSHSRKTEEIEQYVHEHYTIGPDFAMGRAVSLFRLIGEEIAHFSQAK